MCCARCGEVPGLAEVWQLSQPADGRRCPRINFLEGRDLATICPTDSHAGTRRQLQGDSTRKGNWNFRSTPKVHGRVRCCPWKNRGEIDFMPSPCASEFVQFPRTALKPRRLGTAASHGKRSHVQGTANLQFALHKRADLFPKGPMVYLVRRPDSLRRAPQELLQSVHSSPP